MGELCKDGHHHRGRVHQGGAVGAATLLEARTRRPGSPPHRRPLSLPAPAPAQGGSPGALAGSKAKSGLALPMAAAASMHGHQLPARARCCGVSHAARRGSAGAADRHSAVAPARTGARKQRWTWCSRATAGPSMRAPSPGAVPAPADMTDCAPRAGGPTAVQTGTCGRRGATSASSAAPATAANPGLRRRRFRRRRRLRPSTPSLAPALPLPPPPPTPPPPHPEPPRPESHAQAQPLPLPPPPAPPSPTSQPNPTKNAAATQRRACEHAGEATHRSPARRMPRLRLQSTYGRRAVGRRRRRRAMIQPHCRPPIGARSAPMCAAAGRPIPGCSISTGCR